MKTDDLITVLAADNRPTTSVGKTLGACLLAGSLVCATILQTTIGVRSDIVAALSSWRFDWKLVSLAAATILAFACCSFYAKPQQANRIWALWLLPIAFLAAVVLELILLPRDLWMARLVGSNAKMCLMAVPVFALVPLALTLLAMRSGAPSRPGVAGAMAGLAAAALGATFYGLHCFDDSPLFVVTWYSIASLPVILAGTLLGRRLLQW